MAPPLQQENGPTSMALTVLLVVWIGFTFSTVVVGLRIWVRVGKLGKHLAMHDWMMTAAVVSAWSALSRRCSSSLTILVGV